MFVFKCKSRKKTNVYKLNNKEYTKESALRHPLLFTEPVVSELVIEPLVSELVVSELFTELAVTEHVEVSKCSRVLK